MTIITAKIVADKLAEHDIAADSAARSPSGSGFSGSSSGPGSSVAVVVVVVVGSTLGHDVTLGNVFKSCRK